MKRFKSKFTNDLEGMISLKIATHFSESTYLERAKTFDSFCEKKFPESCLLTETIVLAWVKDALDYKTRNVAHSRLSFCRTLGEYQKAIGKTPFIPAKNMLSGKSLFVPYIFTDEEMKDLFEVIDSYQKRSNPFEGILLSVYFRLCYTCGLRPHECRVLKRVDVDLNSGEIRIINTKWNKSRTIIMSDEMCGLMRKYVFQRDMKFPKSEHLFPKRDGNIYSASQIQNRFKKFYELSCPDVPKELLPAVRVYDLRHRFATAVLNKWLDDQMDLNARLPYLQTYMGHKEIASTAYYIHLLPENLAKSAGVDWKELNAIIPEVESWEE